MSYFINLHAHTRYSDGAHHMIDMAKACKDLGFSACVITDHIYADEAGYSNNYKKFLWQCKEAEVVSNIVGIPVIVGAEISVALMEECLLFGRSAIEALLVMRDRKILRKYNSMFEPMCSIQELIDIRSKYSSACFLAHPALGPNHNAQDSNFVKHGGVVAIDGFELINSAQYCFGSFKDTEGWDRPIPDEFKYLIQLCNSDAHNEIALQFCYNETSEAITSEEELISYVKKGGSFKPVLNFKDEGNWLVTDFSC
jgi:hypothetical protein